MSPSEEQLRRALSEGEGTGPDVDTVLVRAAAFRRERRTKILAAAAVVAVVAGVGIGVGFAASRPGGRHAIASDKAANAGPTNASGGGANFGSAGSAAAGAPPVDDILLGHCPRTPPNVSTNTANASASFFTPSATIEYALVCGYVGTGALIVDPATQQPVQHVFRGASATSLVQSITSAPKRPSGMSCKSLPAFGLTRLLVMAHYSNNASAPPILIGIGCDASITNGASISYDWQQPHALDAFISELRTAAASSAASASILPTAVTPAPSTS